MSLEDLQANAAVRGILSDGLVTVVSVQWFGSEALELTYKTPTGKVANELLYRHDEPRLEIVEVGRPWSFDGDGALFRLVSEAQRIRLAHLFDPVLAVHTSVVDPLPHQIAAVYESMLPRQPLRFLLADDPGAGKTIMAGLLIKELIARGDLQSCLVVCPGSLAEQWQDELYRRFQLPFEILTNDKLEAARTGNWFLETNLVIARLDKLSRNEDVQQKLQAPDCRWDLVVCDEAHKMSATFFGGEVKYTKRYRLGQLLSTLTRHFLLMTATPHNGKEEDFQLFMALLDGDRFEGRFRDGVHVADVSDLMRRMVKENLLKFDGTPLFPERIAYTVPYKLSEAEAHLYKSVTDYVREEFNRAEALENDKRAGTVGFALTILQRRLASSPEAIYQSLRRRRERLDSRLRELEVLQRGGQAAMAFASTGPALDPEDVEDLDEAPDNEVEAAEEEILDQATAARSIVELKAEIETLKSLESLALGVRRSGADTKWRELASLLGEIFTAGGLSGQIAEPDVLYGAEEIPKPKSSPRQKLVIFTEHRDTLSYLQERITTLLGRAASVVVIHGGMGREDRLEAQEAFRHDPEVQVLLATDAAGEGINLQRAHLMVNYDLPWNPNRLEQRFGRIHRIGQTEVCHLWNLVADETREGDVYRKLLDKLEQARQSLGGQVFDVLGKLHFEGRPLRDLLVEAIRYGEHPEVQARLTTAVDHALDRVHLQDLLEERALAHDAMDARRVQRIREDMERAEARRLQPHYIESFFREAFQRLGGSAKQREPRRYEITHVPAPVRNRDRLIGCGEPVLPRYERIAFEKSLALIVKTEAAVKDRLTKEITYWDHRAEQLKLQEQAGRTAPNGARQAGKTGARLNSGEARKRADNLRARLQKRLQELKLEAKISPLPPVVLGGVLVVPQGLLNELKRDEPGAAASTVDTQASAARAREIIMEVERQLGFDPTDREFEKLGYDIESRIPGLPAPRPDRFYVYVIQREKGSHYIGQTDDLPGRWREHCCGQGGNWTERHKPVWIVHYEEFNTRQEAVLREKQLKTGFGRKWLNEFIASGRSRQAGTGRLRFIEVKGRVSGAPTITVTRNEILYSLNKPEDYILGIVAFLEGGEQRVHYVREPFQREPDFGATSVNYDFSELLARAEGPT